ncbi:MAG: histidine kinase dimerization/phospho-acceptor domain-containing protein [bacterium]
MAVLSLLSLSVFSCYLFFIIYLVFSHYRTFLHISLIIFILSQSVWALGYAYMQSSHTFADAFFWSGISSLGWSSFPAAFLLFCIAYTGREKYYRTVLIYPTLILPPVFISIAQFSGLVTSVTMGKYGWISVFRMDAWFLLIIIYFPAYTFSALYLIYKYTRQEFINKSIKNCSRVILFCYFIYFISIGLTDFIFPVIGFEAIPPVSPFMSTVMTGGFVFVIWKHNVLEIKTGTANFFDYLIHDTDVLESIIDSLPDMFAVTDKSFQINTANRVFKNSFMENVSGDCSIEDFIDIPEALKNDGEKTALFPLKFSQTKNVSGEDLLLETTVNILREDQQKTAGYVFFITDMTEKEKLVEKVKDSHDKAKKIIEQKSEFLSNMIHEIKTPLNSISGFSEILHCETEVSKRSRFLPIRKKSFELTHLVKNIIDVSKTASGSEQIFPEQIFVKKLLSEITEPYDVLSEGTLKLQNSVDKDLSVFTDAYKLSRIFENIFMVIYKTSESSRTELYVQKTDENRVLFKAVCQSSESSYENLYRTIEDCFVKENNSTVSHHGSLFLTSEVSSKFISDIGAEAHVNKKDTGTIQVSLLIPDKKTGK